MLKLATQEQVTWREIGLGMLVPHTNILAPSLLGMEQPLKREKVISTAFPQQWYTLTMAIARLQLCSARVIEAY